MRFFGSHIFQRAALVIGGLLISSLTGSFALADSPNSVPVDAPLTLHESINATGSNTDPNCQRPAPYSYNDLYGEVDCNPIQLGECEFDMVCYYRRTRSCFPPETKIQMGDGSQKRIEDVRSGDKVWNPVTKRTMAVGRMLKGPETIPLVEIRSGDTVIRVTQKHPMVIESRKPEITLQNAALRTENDRKTSHHFSVKRADEIRVSDRVLGADGKFLQVESSRLLPVEKGQIVYNFELVTESGDVAERMIAADGFVTGDVVVQADLNGDKLPWERQ